MREDSWDFLIADKKDAFTNPNWHSIELKMARSEEFHMLVKEIGIEEACDLLKKRKETIEERNRIWKLENPPWVLERKSLEIAEQAKKGSIVKTLADRGDYKNGNNCKEAIREHRGVGVRAFSATGRDNRSSKGSKGSQAQVRDDRPGFRNIAASS